MRDELKPLYPGHRPTFEELVLTSPIQKEAESIANLVNGHNLAMKCVKERKEKHRLRWKNAHDAALADCHKELAATRVKRDKNKELKDALTKVLALLNESL